jgi:hypothetical protein
MTDDLADDGALNGSLPAVPAKTTQGQAPGGESYRVRSYADNGSAELARYGLVHGRKHPGPAATRRSPSPTRRAPTKRPPCTSSS